MLLEGFSTDVLLEAYEKARSLNLDKDFIHILEEALEERREYHYPSLFLSKGKD